jgi:hypothetical protein
MLEKAIPQAAERWTIVMEDVCRASPDNYAYLNTLSLVYLRAGRSSESVTTIERVLSLRHQAGKPAHPSDLLIKAMAILHRDHASNESREQAQSLVTDAIRAAQTAGLRGDYETESLLSEAQQLLAR